MKRISGRCVLLLAMALIVANANAGDIKEAARAAVTRWQKAIITVRVVAKIKSPRGEEENQLEVTGSVIDPSGLTVVSAQSIDPAAAVKAFLSNMGRQTTDEMKIDSQITQTTMILHDSTEVDADVVLTDADLDLAFIRPRQARKFTSIPLTPRGRPLDPLEDIFVIGRLDRSESRATSINLGMIQAVVKGPRVFYVAGQEVSSVGLGCLVFDAEANPVGIFVAKQRKSAGDKGMAVLMSMMTGTGLSPAARIIRPIEDVLEDAAQAREAPAPQSAPTETQTQP